MKLQFGADQEIGIKRPNKMYGISKLDDGGTRRVWFSRNTLIHLSSDGGTYGQLTVPETIDDMLDHLLANYELPPLPMLDFLYSDSDTSFLADITAAVYVGKSAQGGRPCHHLAFSKANVDYQIWIPTEGKALPVKYSITWTNDPHLPWFTMHSIDWDLSPTFSDEAFVPTLPRGAKQVEVPRKTTQQ